MRDNIVVSVEALYQGAKEMLPDGCTVVEVSIIEAQNNEDPRLKCPPALCFEATSADGDGVDYDPIDAVEGTYTYPEEE